MHNMRKSPGGGQVVNRNRVRIWSPSPDQLDAGMWDAVARTLSSAFSSRDWQNSPMPVGDASDAHSAVGVMTELRDGPLLVATRDAADVEVTQVVGCVLGGVLNESLIDSYRLGNFGARTGDAILAYIGVTPEAQGIRGFPRNNGFLDKIFSSNDTPRKPDESDSLAGAMFSTWLELPEIASCPTVFVRTRETIGSMLHLLSKHGFEHQGRFDLEFHGSLQSRLVYRRHNHD